MLKLPFEAYFHGPWTGARPKEIEELRVSFSRFSPLELPQSDNSVSPPKKYCDSKHMTPTWQLYAGKVTGAMRYLWIETDGQSAMMLYTGNGGPLAPHCAVVDAVMTVHEDARQVGSEARFPTGGVRKRLAARSADATLDVALRNASAIPESFVMGDEAYGALRRLYKEMRERRGLPVLEAVRL